MPDGVEPGQDQPHRVAGDPEPLPAGVLPSAVAKLAGEPWAEWPSGVHPTLGAIARAVDAHSGPEARAALLPLAPGLVGTAVRGLDTSARLVAMCAATALACPERQHITADESRRLARRRDTAMHLLRGRGSRYVLALPDGEQEPRLHGPARWWVPLLGPAGLDEPVYRRFVSTEHAADAVAVTARAAGADRDLRLRQLLRMCIAAARR